MTSARTTSPTTPPTANKNLSAFVRANARRWSSSAPPSRTVNVRRPKCSGRHPRDTGQLDAGVEAAHLGLAEITLRRARKALGVQVRREGFGKDGRFLVALPSNGSDAADQAAKVNAPGRGNGFDHEHAEQSVPREFPVS